jgi:hypothetical protein
MRCQWLVLALLSLPATARADDVSAVVGEDGIEFKAGSAAAARYSIDPKYSKPFLYPVLAPGNVPVTRAYPIEPGTPGGSNDHPHHKSVWFCHGDVVPEGMSSTVKSNEKGAKGVDFWSETVKDGVERFGKIACKKIGEPKSLAQNHTTV